MELDPVLHQATLLRALRLWCTVRRYLPEPLGAMTRTMRFTALPQGHEVTLLMACGQSGLVPVRAQEAPVQRSCSGALPLPLELSWVLPERLGGVWVSLLCQWTQSRGNMLHAGTRAGGAQS